MILSEKGTILANSDDSSKTTIILAKTTMVLAI
jgi:hypothetical protein